MKPSRPDLEKTFKSCDDEELIRRLQSGTLTELAQEVALAEATSRGLALPEVAETDEASEMVFANAAEAALVTIARFTLPTEAHLVRTFMESKGIYAAVIGGHYMQATAPWEVNYLGGVRLMVPAGQLELARELLEEYKGGSFTLPDDADPA